MKLVRHRQAGQERPQLIDSEGNIRDLIAIFDNFGFAFFAKDGIGRLKSFNILSLLRPSHVMRLGIDGLGIQEQRVLRWGEQ
ncbi:hypothetical protein [Polaromonas sp.]|uniref:hypothetical protein n=1 Tax=Polaromonas sp. TaxID=1869339 RepID=UPI0017AF2CAA|nr:hypothetical protein [Polaromonas sp.]NMM06753.1 hypothetical protein [Polaromonas sp.]